VNFFNCNGFLLLSRSRRRKKYRATILLAMKRLLLLLLVTTSALAASPSTVNNDDTCDVTVSPAATLLLPYFEVDLTNRAQDTLFTITNVTRYPQIAHVTIWTDWSFPVLAFNIYLTGYDVQGLSMQQVLDGLVAQTNGTGPTSAQSPVGQLSAGFTANPNFAGGGASINCSKQPGQLAPTLTAALKSVLTTGVYASGGNGACANRVGGVHAHAIGYITIDVVSNCSLALPTDPLYYKNDLLFDNALIGDYQQLGPHPAGEASRFDAGVNPLVHIRAVPEGGGTGSHIAVSGLPYTFYDRFTPASSRTIDRRQPLPSTFAARFVQGDPGAFRTNLNIWREGFGSGSCTASAAMSVAEVVRFDEHENPSVLGSDALLSRPRLPATSSTSSSDPSYPATTSADLGGWLYLNLGNGGSTSYSATHNDFAPAGSTTTVGPRPSQNWVTVTMFSNLVRSGQAQPVAAEFDAPSLGNGCSPAAFPTSASPIGPSGGVFVCPPGTTLTNGSVAQCTNTAGGGGGSVASAARRRAVQSSAPAPSIANDDSCDIKVGPAATLLLPYFEVDVSGASGQTTLFTVTNVSRYPQIAHVTLWTDYAYPVLTFNLFVGGYAVRPINLADVLVRNTIDGTAGSILPSANPNLRAPADCATIAGVVPETVMAAVRAALTTGAAGNSCNHAVGALHTNAIGYATIDVVASCTTRLPADPLYYTEDLLFDNVLIGDYQQVGASPAGTAASAFDATGNPMVHIRAVPEGGGAGSNVDTRLPYTFYDRYTPAKTRTIDRRQPLPSLFAARYIQGGAGAFATNVTIWREGVGTGGCADTLASANMPIWDIVGFDEHENAILPPPCGSLCGMPPPSRLPAASSTATSNAQIYPHVAFQDVGGWLYLDLNNGGSTSYSVTREINGQRIPTNARTNLTFSDPATVGPRPSQNWVTVTISGTLPGGNRLAGEFDAAALGNGCSPVAPYGLAIAPVGRTFVCPPGTTLTNGSRDQCWGTNINPTP